MNIEMSAFRHLACNSEYSSLFDQVDVREEMISGKAIMHLPSIALLLLCLSVHEGLILAFQGLNDRIH